MEASMRGDHLCPRPLITMTRSILVQASPAEVWPWIAQIGQNRGGFYSYAWLENLGGASIVNADTVVEAFQITAPGDLVTIHPRQPPFRAVEVDAPGISASEVPTPRVPAPGGALVLWGDEGLVARTSWALLLDEDRGRTRLTARMRVDRGELGALRASAHRVFLNLLLRPGHALMEGAMLRGIRGRAEGARAARSAAGSS